MRHQTRNKTVKLTFRVRATILLQHVQRKPSTFCPPTLSHELLRYKMNGLMAKHIPPWLAEPVVSKSGNGGPASSRGRCGLGARPWFPTNQSEHRWQVGRSETYSMLGVPPGPLQPDAWVRSLSVPPSMQATDESGWSTPMHSPRPAPAASLNLTQQALSAASHVRYTSSVSPRASSTSSLGYGGRSVPEGPAIPAQRRAPNRFSLNAMSSGVDVGPPSQRVIHARADILSIPPSHAHATEPARTACRTSNVLLEKNQRVPQYVDCKQAEAPVLKNESEYVIYAKNTSVLPFPNNPAPVTGVSDGSPKNSVWKRYFAEGGSGNGPPLRREMHPDLSSPSLPATAPNSERGAQETLASHALQDQVPVERPLKPINPIHEKKRDRSPERPPKVQKGLRDVVGLFGTPAVEAVQGRGSERSTGSTGSSGDRQDSATHALQASATSRQPERRPSDMTDTSRMSTASMVNPTASQAVEGEQFPSFSVNTSGSESFVPDMAQFEAITQSAANVEAAAKKISLKHLHELRSFRQPPAAICQVAEAALSLFGINATWSSGRRRLDSQFLQKLKSFTPLEAARFPSAQVHQFLEHLDAPAFSDQSLLEKCPGAAPLAQWCFAAAALLLHLQVSDASGKLSRCRDGATVTKTKEGHVQPGQVGPETKVEIKTLAPGPERVRNSVPDLGGLFVKPSLWELSSEELQQVEDLVIGRVGVGHVTFHGRTDCRGLSENLSQILSIQPGEIIVYPDATLKPEVGQGLNKPASVQLHGCMPKCQTRLTDNRAQQRYKQRVAQMTQEKGAIFEDYDPTDGTWKFRVPHF